MVAWVLGEASAFEAAELERIIAEKPELGIFKRRMEAVHGLVAAASRLETDPMRLSEERRGKLLETLGVKEAAPAAVVAMPERKPGWRFTWKTAVGIAACLAVMALLASISLPAFTSVQVKAHISQELERKKQAELAAEVAAADEKDGGKDDDNLLSPAPAAGQQDLGKTASAAPENLAALDSLKALASNTADRDDESDASGARQPDRLTTTSGISVTSPVHYRDLTGATDSEEARLRFEAAQLNKGFDYRPSDAPGTLDDNSRGIIAKAGESTTQAAGLGFGMAGGGGGGGGVGGGGHPSGGPVADSFASTGEISGGGALASLPAPAQPVSQGASADSAVASTDAPPATESNRFAMAEPAAPSAAAMPAAPAAPASTDATTLDYQNYGSVAGRQAEQERQNASDAEHGRVHIAALDTADPEAVATVVRGMFPDEHGSNSPNADQPDVLEQRVTQGAPSDATDNSNTSNGGGGGAVAMRRQISTPSALALSGANTYAGNTTVTAGQLEMGGVVVGADPAAPVPAEEGPAVYTQAPMDREQARLAGQAQHQAKALAIAGDVAADTAATASNSAVAPDQPNSPDGSASVDQFQARAGGGKFHARFQLGTQTATADLGITKAGTGDLAVGPLAVTESEEKAKVPILGDIPLLGRDFQSQAKKQAVQDQANAADRLPSLNINAGVLMKPLAPTPPPQDEVSATDQPYSTFSLHVSDVSFLLAQAALAAGADAGPRIRFGRRSFTMRSIMAIRRRGRGRRSRAASSRRRIRCSSSGTWCGSR